MKNEKIIKKLEKIIIKIRKKYYEKRMSVKIHTPYYENAIEELESMEKSEINQFESVIEQYNKGIFDFDKMSYL